MNHMAGRNPRFFFVQNPNLKFLLWHSPLLHIRDVNTDAWRHTGGGKLLHRVVKKESTSRVPVGMSSPRDKERRNKGPRRNEEKAGGGQIKSPMIRTSIKSKSAMKLTPLTRLIETKNDPKQSVLRADHTPGPVAWKV